jgi:hypothetical protein
MTTWRGESGIMRSKTKKATFNLHPDVLAALDEAMARGAAPSKNVLVERALMKELKELQRQARQAQWQEGARDPLLLKDMGEVEATFQHADAETARRMG